MWEHFMALIGSFVGAALGYLAAGFMDGLTLLLSLVVVRVVVGSLLLAFVGKVALSILAGALSRVGPSSPQEGA
jgi:type III secretory pathway component EscR